MSTFDPDYAQEPADNTVGERATGADVCFTGRYNEGDDRSNLVDLLADLMHWADWKVVDFDDCLESARGYYDAERKPKEAS